MGALDRLKPGDLLARVTSDTTLLRSVSTYGLVHSVNAAFMLVASVVLMGMIDPVLLAVTLAVLALNGLAVLVVVPRIRRATERSQAAVGGMGSELERSLGSFRTVKAMGAEEREIRSVRSAARRAWRGGRGGRLDGAHGGVGRARRAGVVPGRAGRGRAAGRQR